MFLHKRSRTVLSLLVVSLLIFVHAAYAFADGVESDPHFGPFMCPIECDVNMNKVHLYGDTSNGKAQDDTTNVKVQDDTSNGTVQDDISVMKNQDVDAGGEGFLHLCEDQQLKSNDIITEHDVYNVQACMEHVLLPMVVSSSITCWICFPDGIGSMPGVGNPHSVFVDNSIAKWVGGNFTATGRFAESEGLNVIRGNLYLQTQGLVNFGVVGVGSGIFPANESVMLAVGGNVTVTYPSWGKVGAPIPAGIFTGQGFIGGSITGRFVDVWNVLPNDSAFIHTDLGAAATSHWNNFEGRLRSDSAYFRSREATGTVSLGNNITFHSTNPTANPQVFNINAAVLNNMASWGTIAFTGIPVQENGLYTPVVINVYGGPINFGFSRFLVNGVFVDYPLSNPRFGNASSALLWNFADTTSLRINGTSQFMGSIIAPNTQSTFLEVHTNGRLFVNGNLTRTGTGTEHHNFPWLGGSNHFTCSHGTGITTPGNGGGGGGGTEICYYCEYPYEDCQCYGEYCEYCDEPYEDCICYRDYTPCEICEYCGYDPCDCDDYYPGGGITCEYCDEYPCECDEYYPGGGTTCEYCDEYPCECDNYKYIAQDNDDGSDADDTDDDENEKKDDTRTRSPETGDNLRLSIWITLLFASSMVFAIVAIMKHRVIKQ